MNKLITIIIFVLSSTLNAQDFPSEDKIIKKNEGSSETDAKLLSPSLDPIKSFFNGIFDTVKYLGRSVETVSVTYRDRSTGSKSRQAYEVAMSGHVFGLYDARVYSDSMIGDWRSVSDTYSKGEIRERALNQKIVVPGRFSHRFLSYDVALRFSDRLSDVELGKIKASIYKLINNKGGHNLEIGIYRYEKTGGPLSIKFHGVNIVDYVKSSTIKLSENFDLILRFSVAPSLGSVALNSDDSSLYGLKKDYGLDDNGRFMLSARSSVGSALRVNFYNWILSSLILEGHLSVNGGFAPGGISTEMKEVQGVNNSYLNGITSYVAGGNIGVEVFRSTTIRFGLKKSTHHLVVDHAELNNNNYRNFSKEKTTIESNEGTLDIEIAF